MTPGRELVSFVVAGAQKAGTTALDAMLRAHPELCLPEGRKELHFFDRAWPEPDPDCFFRYDAMFDPAPGQACGEATPIYAYWPGCLERVARYDPAMRVVMILRDPAERAHSHWAMERGRGAEALGFAEAIRAEPARLEAAGGHHRVYSYAARGRYAGQVRRARSLFGEERVHLIRYDDYRSDVRGTMRRLFGFLGVRDDVAVTPREAFGSGRGAMEPADRAWLVGRLADDVRELEGLTGWDLEGWRAA